MTAEPSIYTPLDITKRRSLMDSSEAKEKYKQRCEFHRLLRKNCTPNEYSIFCSLDDRASEINDGWCFPSYDTIMEDCNIQNRNAVTTALIRLFDLELIEWCLDGRQGCYRPVQPDSTVLERLSYQINTKDSINSVLSIVSKRYSNGTNRTINKINDPTTPNGVVAAPPAETSPDENISFGPSSRQEAASQSQPDPVPVPEPATNPTSGRPGKREKTQAPGQVIAQATDPPLSKHPAVKIYQDIMARLPNPHNQKRIAEEVGTLPLCLAEWQKNCDWWAGHEKWNKTNIVGLLDSYKGKNYEQGRSNVGRNGAAPATTAAKQFGYNLARDPADREREFREWRLPGT